MLPIDRETHERVMANVPVALRRRSEAGFAAFSAMAMPSEKEENWRYVHTRVDLADHLIAATPGSPLGPTDAGPGLTGDAVSVDGHTVTATAVDEVAVTGLAGAPDAGEPAVIDDRFVALHEAFSFDGVIIEAPAGAAAARPVVVDLQAVTPGVLALPRVRLVAGRSSHLAVIVLQRSPDGVSALAVPRFEIVADAAARVDLTVVQQWGSATLALARHHAVVGRDATVRIAEAGLGGQYSRLHLTVDLVGDGAAADVVGAYFGDADQVLDYRYFMRHAARGTTSQMFLKGAVAGDARSVFSGLIRIEPEGQKTSAHQTNRNLVLSDRAEAHSVPNLEILADDVRCGHGSAVGPLDEEQRYYLMSRGLDRERADRLQVKGFFDEALARFPDLRLEAFLRGAAMTKYAGVAR